MPYDRPWKSFEDQLNLLKSRGLAVGDEKRAREYLERLGYYRLSAYWYPFRKYTIEQDASTGKLSHRREDEFIENARFQDAVELYVFDKRLRLLALDALERIEVGVRVDVAYLLGERDTFAYQNPSELHGKFTTKKNTSTGITDHEEWLNKYEQLVERSREPFVEHYKNTHGLPLPIWVAIELLDFGLLSKLFAGLKFKDKETISAKYGVSSGPVFASWLRSLNFLRNICAHHSRLWNRNIIDQPKLAPAGEIAVFDQFAGKPDLLARPFLLFCITQWMMRQLCPNSSWGTRFKSLLSEFPENRTGKVEVNDIGIVPGWETWDLWI